MSAQSLPIEAAVNRSLNDRTHYLCHQSCGVTINSILLSGGNFKHITSKLSVMRWHAPDHSAIQFDIRSGPFDFSQDISSAEARAFAAALVMAADEFDAQQSAQQQVAEVQP